MIKNSVSAVIVTYNGSIKLKDNIDSLLKQVEMLVIIDNCSEENLSGILNYAEENGVKVIKNTVNKGIAVALNQALSMATEYNYFLTMDQDTILSDDCVKIMLTELEEYKLASIGPSYNVAVANKAPKAINFLITSGNLTKTQVAIETGGFDDWMFIDGVDIDFSLKIRALGYKIAQSSKARMVHSIGENEVARFLFFAIPIRTHSLLRYYYMARNNLYLQKKHKKSFPFYCFKLRISFFLFKLKIFFLYKNKYDILVSIRCGRADARKHKTQ